MSTETFQRDRMTAETPSREVALPSRAHPLREAATAPLWRSSATLAVALVLALGLLAAIWLLARPLAMLAAAVVLAQAVEPAISWLDRRLPRGGAVGLVYLALLALFGGLLWIVVPSLVSVAREAAMHLPSFVVQARSLVEGWEPSLVQGADEATESIAGSVGPALARVPVMVGQAAVGAVLILVMAAYWSLATPDLRSFSFSFVPRRHRARTSDVAREMFDTMGGYVRARGLTALLVAATVWAGLFLLDVEYNTTLALLAGLGDLIPFIGPPLAIVPALLVALLDSPTKAALVIALYLVVQQLKSHVVGPLLMRHQASIPPLVVVFALVVGSSIGGVIGTLVATPLAGALRVLILRVIAPVVRRRLREDDFGPLPAA